MKNNEERKTEKKRKKRFVPYEASVNITCILYIMDACTIHMVNHHTKNFVLNKNVFCGRGDIHLHFSHEIILMWKSVLRKKQ